MRLPFEVQTRTHCGELKYWASLKDAFIYAKSNENVWKVSFETVPGERCRLVKLEDGRWLYEDIMTMVTEEMEKLAHERKVQTEP